MSTEAETRNPFQALDACSSKKVDFVAEQDFNSFLQKGPFLTLTCAKYPEGTPYLAEKDVAVHGERNKIAMRLGCVACEFRNGISPEIATREAQVSGLHEKIREIPGRLYIDGHFTESVFRGLVTVKETLREVSGGHESAADAIGKGGLYFRTERGEHVEKAFQQAAQFSLMAVDNLRNVEAHSLPHPNEVEQGPEYAYPRLMLCTLALNFLDNAEVRR